MLIQGIPLYLITLKIILMLIFSQFNPHMLNRNFNSCNTINSNNRMRKSELGLEKYWVTRSGYFRLMNTVVLGAVIVDANLLFCRAISWQRKDKKISFK